MQDCLNCLRTTVNADPVSLEFIVLRGEDWDGKQFECNELVTLYNLDFCNALTGSVLTSGGLKKLRFEILLKIAALQRDLYRRQGASKFVLLLTVFDAFHIAPVRRRFNDPDLPEATRRFVASVRHSSTALESAGMYQNTELLKAFVFTCVSDYLRGQNMQSVFLPPVAYTGSTAKSPMLHFAVVCEMGPQDLPLGDMEQSATDFFALATVRATETAIVLQKPRVQGLNEELDPVAFINKYAIAT